MLRALLTLLMVAPLCVRLRYIEAVHERIERNNPAHPEWLRTHGELERLRERISDAFERAASYG